MLDIPWPKPLTEEQLKKLDAYRRLLLDWNERMNLTAITDEPEVYVKHFYDSLAVLMVPEWKKIVRPGLRVIDVGTGAGFPGIPLAIVEEDVEFVLNDALQKRVGFLQAVVDELNLANVRVIHARSEDLAREMDYRQQFDVVVSRAVARLNILMELMCPFLRVGGVGFSYKGPGFDDERVDGLRAAKRLGAALKEPMTYTLPLEMGARTIVAFEQITPISNTYPRKAGIPQRKPL
ncbi:16S rRNA (guanine(527)-N(7))-methyltransferase RsmG [Alicyclobacillus fastidiosus]|uniref:Ribosomal RNA small subunit methyltransferase G n=1 Tax=Alicyclobacillus fastidiosus TaxID=392011 RepID=A0ABV5AF44_9BACL|nr:16S rRNA (guanine(527)-N(7))-methyltransferase RsmG [Alicyclobacillus fastidiosus]WEH09722.1 16S rRNA (guanine(527)-N(7))-methyltransferase RsmG [Alicyclobacillus fastidiosus]